MKKLIFIRHGQAEGSYDKPDFERKLTDFGIKEVRSTALQFKEKNLCIEKIISSSAVRTKMTSENICDVLGLDIDKISFDKYIYEFFSSAEFIENIVSKIDDKYNTVLIVGHNPTISTIVQMFTGNYDVYFDTANSYVVEFNVDFWLQVVARTGKIISFISPKI